MSEEITITELTDQEKALIEQRRKEAEEQAKKEYEELMRLESEAREKAEKEFAEYSERVEKINKATKTFFEDAFKKEDWKISTTVEKLSKNIYVKGKTVDTVEKEYSRYFLEKGKYVVNVHEHFVDVSGRYSFRSRLQSKGMKMYISGPGIDYNMSERAYARPKTVIDKINGIINKENYRISHLKKHQVAADEVFNELKTKYPEAVATLEEDWNYGYNRYSRRSIYDKPKKEYKAVLKFENGLIVSYNIYSDKSKSVNIRKFPAKGEDLVNILKNIEKIDD